MKATLKKMMPDKFAALVDEASKLWREIYVSNQFGDARDEKLSAKGYLAEALHNARTTLKKIEELDKVVSNLPPDDTTYNDMHRFIGTVYAQAIATRYDKGCALRPVVGNLHRMVGGDPQAYVNVIVGSNSLSSNPFECVALAALRATRDHPEAFGTIDDWDKHHAAQAAKTARLEELYAQIATEWRTADLVFDDNAATITVAYEGVTLPVAPPNTLGFRLCEALA
jgi:hypothetical protein